MRENVGLNYSSMDVQVKSKSLGYVSLIALALSMAGCGLLGLGGKRAEEIRASWWAFLTAKAG